MVLLCLNTFDYAVCLLWFVVDACVLALGLRLDLYVLVLGVCCWLRTLL